MKFLQTNKRVLTWLCVCSPDAHASKWQRVFMITFAISILAANGSAILIDLYFFRQSLAKDLDNSLYSLFQIAASGSVTYELIVAMCLKNRFDRIFEKLSDIQNASKIFAFILCD